MPEILETPSQSSPSDLTGKILEQYHAHGSTWARHHHHHTHEHTGLLTSRTLSHEPMLCFALLGGFTRRSSSMHSVYA